MKNIFADIPKNLESEIFERLIDTDNVQIERIISLGQRSPETGWFNQDKNEWVMVLKGEAVLIFEDGSISKMKSGDHINIPAHKKHRVDQTSTDSEAIWLAVHYQ